VDDLSLGSLWRAAEDGSDRRQVLAQGRYNLGSQYTEPSGLVFTQVSDKDLAGHVWRIDPDGSGLRQLTRGAGEELMTLSPDGRTLLFSRADERGTIWSLDPVAGGEPKLLVSDSTGDRPAISPDGRLIGYGKFETVDGLVRRRLVLIPIGGGDPVATFSLPDTTGTAIWGPDSRSMVLLDRAGGWNAFRRSMDGGEPVPLTRFADGVCDYIGWSRDGARLVMARRIGPKCQVWSVTPGKGDPRLLAEFRSGLVRSVVSTLDSRNFLFTYVATSKDVVLISGIQ
jgi:Tol biopolymer transport system component